MRMAFKGESLRIRSGTVVVEGKVSQGSAAYKDYTGPNGIKLRILNPDIRAEANRRAAKTIRANDPFKGAK